MHETQLDTHLFITYRQDTASSRLRGRVARRARAQRAAFAAELGHVRSLAPQKNALPNHRRVNVPMIFVCTKARLARKLIKALTFAHTSTVLRDGPALTFGAPALQPAPTLLAERLAYSPPPTSQTGGIVQVRAAPCACVRQLCAWLGVLASPAPLTIYLAVLFRSNQLARALRRLWSDFAKASSAT